MAHIYGKDYSKIALMKQVGDISQIADMQLCELKNGKADGVSCVNVKTGSGLCFSVLPGRGMDIAWVDYKGKPISFISKTGVVSSHLYDERDLNFLRSFYGGMLTTCGLTYMGATCVDEGQPLGVHGRISNTPAENVAIHKEWQDDEYIMRIQGTMRESRVFAENTTLKRTISTAMGSKKLMIEDLITNEAYDAHPFMLLYHFNFGFPLVNEGSKIFTCETNSVRARDTEAQKGIDTYADITTPVHGFQEQVYYYDLKDTNDIVYAGIYNDEMQFGVYLKYFKSQLPYLIEWKQMGEGDYVIGLEPATWYPEGRAAARARGELAFLQPWESRKINIELGIIDTPLEEWTSTIQ